MRIPPSSLYYWQEARKDGPQCAFQHVSSEFGLVIVVANKPFSLTHFSIFLLIFGWRTISFPAVTIKAGTWICEFREARTTVNVCYHDSKNLYSSGIISLESCKIQKVHTDLLWNKLSWTKAVCQMRKVSAHRVKQAHVGRGRVTIPKSMTCNE